MRPWLRGGVAVVASLATLTIAVQVLVLEPTEQAAEQAVRTAAARGCSHPSRRRSAH